ncbi:MAG: hypothetical protein JSU87_03175 [Gemmatimonadota bacterium]|nr:MAG: hypothetical protein JSU87_03175 [Gemmatimonadota bacterium]
MPYSILVGAISGSVLAALSFEPSRYTELYMPAADQLRPYARFPQGMPEGFR